MPDQTPTPGPTGLSRRRLIQLGAAGLVVAGAGAGYAGIRMADNSSPIGPRSRLVDATERARSTTGATVRKTLRAAPGTVDLGGLEADTWLFGDQLPGAEIRANVGDRVRILLQNSLPDKTTVHWHGVALRNDMDGVPGLTQKSVLPGGQFEYSFVAADPGTYWFHPHVGIQLDTGLYAPLIVEDPNERTTYDEEAVLILDDWTDGVDESPKQILELLGRKGMGGMGMGSGGMRGMMPSKSKPLGSDGGDVKYSLHLINGRQASAPSTITSKPGRRIRLRIINAAADTAYRFAVGGHRLTVTHTDGFAVDPVEVDTLILGMGERYDVVITAGDGAFPIVAVPESKADPSAMGVLRTAEGSVPPVGQRPDELGGQILTYADLRPVNAARLADRRPDREMDLTLTSAKGGREWRLNGKTYQDHEPLQMSAGERVQIKIHNRSMMFHPIHLHGHTFALTGKGDAGARKDTVNVPPMRSQTIDLEGDNPGQWMVHCHNAYHGELGMMTVLSYVR